MGKLAEKVPGHSKSVCECMEVHERHHVSWEVVWRCTRGLHRSERGHVRDCRNQRFVNAREVPYGLGRLCRCVMQIVIVVTL